MYVVFSLLICKITLSHTRAFPKETIDSLQPLPSALGASIRRAVAFPGSLHGPVRARG